jgi:hypothetical protein
VAAVFVVGLRFIEYIAQCSLGLQFLCCLSNELIKYGSKKTQFQESLQETTNFSGVPNLCFRNEKILRRYILTKTQKLIVGLKINQTRLTVTGFDVHGSVHHNLNRVEITNKMRQCSRIYC